MEQAGTKSHRFNVIQQSAILLRKPENTFQVLQIAIATKALFPSKSNSVAQRHWVALSQLLRLQIPTSLETRGHVRLIFARHCRALV